MAKYIDIPFAENGDKQTIPATTTDGTVNYSDGFGVGYSKPIGSSPIAKPLKRENINQVLNDVTGAVKDLQEHGVFTWQSTKAGGYDVGATVLYNGINYTNTIAGNTATPGATGSGWNREVSTVTTLADMIAIVAPSDNDVCVVTDNNQGGTFVYDSTQSAVNNGGTVFNGWIRQYAGAVNVKWFGAKGDYDGTNATSCFDNTNAIQSALNVAKSEVFIEKADSSYAHKNIITVDSKTLSSNGATLTAIDDSADLLHSLLLTGTKPELLGFVLDTNWTGARSSKTSAQKVVVNNAYNYIVKECSITGSAASGIYSNNSDEGYIINNKVSNTLADGIHNTNAVTNAKIYGNTVLGSGDDCIAVVSYDNGYAVCRNIQITNNTVENGLARGIAVDGGDTIIISNNIVINPKASGIIAIQDSSYNTQAATNITISDNYISDGGSKTTGLPAIMIGGSPVECRSISVSNNNCVNCHSEGIRVRYVNDLVASNNIFSGSDDMSYAVRFIGTEYTNISITNNNFSNTLSYGVSTIGGGDVFSGVFITGNKFNNINTSGATYVDVINISASSVVNYIDVSGNTLTNTGVIQNFLECAHSNIRAGANYSDNKKGLWNAVGDSFNYQPLYSDITRAINYANAVPTIGEHSKGELVYKYSPSAGGNIGWVCVTEGTPGTWKAFGTIAS